MASHHTFRPLGLLVSVLAGVALGGFADSAGADAPTAAPSSSYIVQADSVAAARAAVEIAGGSVAQDFQIINAVEASVSDTQLLAVRGIAGVRVYANRTLTASKKNPSLTLQVLATNGSTVALTDGSAPAISSLAGYLTDYTAQTGADVLQKSGITGKNVTIAVLDSGLWTGQASGWSQSFKGPGASAGRLQASYDVLNGGAAVTSDPYGHGTHITSIMAGGAQNAAGSYFGIAPDANLVIVRAFDANGCGSYANVIAGLNWIVANQAKYKIRVLNLSFGALPQSAYWDDPINQAVMRAWQAGIVVVTAAGNQGPTPMTVDVPGNLPYVITVGALTDNQTPFVFTDDSLASFSSTGPTYEGFVKPEVIAPGGHMVGTMSPTTTLANIDPNEMSPGQSLFTMSGTSQAAAVTSGIVALMLQKNPALTPDDVKCRLMASATAAMTPTGLPAYTVFQQGAGLVNAGSAVNSTASGCANIGLNIAADLAGTTHFGGPANVDANGNYYIMDVSASVWGTALAGPGLRWDTSFPYGSGYSWASGRTWTKGNTWTTGRTWTKGQTWTTGTAWSSGYSWSTSVPWWNGSSTKAPPAAPTSIVNWVPNQ